MVKGWNEPCKLIEILDIISNVLGIDKEIIAQETFENSLKLFPIKNL